MGRIILQFDEGETRISGNPFGRKVYSEQVSQKINLKEENTIVFPNSIKKVGESFVQGFFAELAEELEQEKLIDKIKIETSSIELTMDIYEKISRGVR